MKSVRTKPKKTDPTPKIINKSQMNLTYDTDSTAGKNFTKLQKVQINQAILSNKVAASYAFEDSRQP